jgi:hypothetical protein
LIHFWLVVGVIQLISTLKAVCPTADSFFMNQMLSR